MGKNKKVFLIFFGLPACGKGTQSDMVGQKLKLPVISPGELLRATENKTTALGRSLAVQMAKGQLVSDKIVERIINLRMKKRDTKSGVIFDGYPRNYQQFKYFQKRVAKIASGDDKIVAIYINCSDKEVKKRITGRRVCRCGASYHLVYNPPQKKNLCNFCGEKLKIREDDKPAVLKERLKLFHAHIDPLAENFGRLYNLIIVDGDKNITKVKQDLWSKLKKII